MIHWVLQKLGLVAAPGMTPAVSAVDDISDDYEFVPAPIIKKPRTPELIRIMSHFSSQPTTAPPPPVLRRSILNDYTKEFFNQLERIIGNPPVNQTPPTISDLELLPRPLKKKTFNHLKPIDASAGNQNAFSDVLSQIKAIKKANETVEEIEIAEPVVQPMKFSEARISQRLAITQGLFQMKADHFIVAIHEQKVLDEPVIHGESAPIAPPFANEEPLLSELQIPLAPVFR
jgi:hypothetical protein